MIQSPVKIGLVEDHTLIRDVIASVINSFDGFLVTLVADNGKQFIEKINSGNIPEILILDLSMPEMDGHETLHWISKNRSDLNWG